MSSSEETVLKGGHPPAVKVGGGMRITQNKSPSTEKPEPTKEKLEDGEAEDDEEFVSESPPKSQIVISGVVAKGDADFPTVAVQATHSKPQPSHEYRHANSKPNIIMQPRKQ